MKKTGDRKLESCGHLYLWNVAFGDLIWSAIRGSNCRPNVAQGLRLFLVLVYLLVAFGWQVFFPISNKIKQLYYLYKNFWPVLIACALTLKFSIKQYTSKEEKHQHEHLQMLRKHINWQKRKSKWVISNFKRKTKHRYTIRQLKACVFSSKHSTNHLTKTKNSDPTNACTLYLN